MFIVFEYNLLDINKIILLNLKKNLNFYSLDKHELDSSEYFYIDYNNFNSLESVIHVNKQFEYYNNFKEEKVFFHLLQQNHILQNLFFLPKPFFHAL